MTTTLDLSRASDVAKAYVGVDLGHHALDDAEVVLLSPFPPAGNSSSSDGSSHTY